MKLVLLCCLFLVGCNPNGTRNFYESKQRYDRIQQRTESLKGCNCGIAKQISPDNATIHYLRGYRSLDSMTVQVDIESAPFTVTFVPKQEWAFPITRKKETKVVIHVYERSFYDETEVNIGFNNQRDWPNYIYMVQMKDGTLHDCGESNPVANENYVRFYSGDRTMHTILKDDLEKVVRGSLEPDDASEKEYYQKVIELAAPVMRCPVHGGKTSSSFRKEYETASRNLENEEI